MGLSASRSSRKSNKDKDNNSNNGTSESSSNGNSKGNRGAKPKFASPENRVLPVVPNGPQKLRRTDNGNILLSGGTISGRKNLTQGPQKDVGFMKFLQGKTNACQPDNGSFVFGHRKSHSDPDIVRKMMEENETEEDEDVRCEGASNFAHRSRIALSPSKAKIKSRKKNKAPEPPQSNTLPRTTRHYETQDVGQFNASHDLPDIPRRPLPPIPLDEVPPPPPPPPPDYIRTVRDREQMKVSNGKNFQKNRRIVEKGYSKRNSEYFPEENDHSQRSDKNGDKNFQIKSQLNSSCETFNERYTTVENVGYKNNSAHHISQDNEKIPPRTALNDEIIIATRKRAERLARVTMNQDLSPRESTDHNFGVLAKGSSELQKKKQHYQSQNENLDFSGKAFHSAQGLPNRQRSLSEQRYAVSNESHHGFKKDYRNIREGIRHENYGRDFSKPYHDVNGYKSHHNETVDAMNEQLNRRNPYVEHQRETTYYRQHHETPNENAAVQYNGLSHDQDVRTHYEYREKTERYSSCATNSHGVTYQSSHLKYKKEVASETHTNRKQAFKNCSRVDRAQETPSENTQKSFMNNSATADGKFNHSHDKLSRLDSGILTSLPSDKEVAQNLFLPVYPKSPVSSSSPTEDEVEINLQIRPTLPRKPPEITDFSAVQCWKSISDHFFLSHVPQIQQHAEVSSEDGEHIKEEKICLISRPVAPRRFLQDISVDSGISPDSGSQVYLNETVDPSNVIIAHDVLCCTDVDLNDDVNATWVPQQDLDESDCGSDSPSQNEFDAPNNVVQPKFSLPNLMFPSRSLPRTENKNETENRETTERDKTRNKDRRKKGFRNSETQHFNSLRNLKRALGMSPKVPIVDVDGLDSNWSLSKSLPSFEEVNNLDNAKMESEVPEVSILDHIRRSNSESRVIQQENGRIYSNNNSQNKNPEWRKSFPGQSSEGHVMYLPKYTAVPCQISANCNDTSNDIEIRDNIKNESSEKKINSATGERNSKIKKKFSYQSTVRQLEKKKMEEKIAKEVAENEKKRETEIEWMNIVEDEFRKQRVREKSDVKQKLRIYALEANRQAKSSKFSNLQSYELNNEKNFEDIDCHGTVPHYNISSQNHTENHGNGIMQDITNENNLTNHFPTFGTNLYTQNSRNCSQEDDASQNFTRAQENAVPKINGLESRPIQAVYKSVEQIPVFKSITHKKSISVELSKAAHSQGETYNKQAQLNNQMPFENNLSNDCSAEYSYAYGNNRGMDFGSKIEQNAQPHNIPQRYSYPLNNEAAQDIDHQVLSVIKNEQKIEKMQAFDLMKYQRDSSSSVEENDGKRNKFNDNGSPNSAEQPTGMKKWLRRQTRQHPRPDPEGGRSSGDDGNANDGKNAPMLGRSQPIGANAPNKCRHGNLQCGICKTYINQNGLPRKDTNVSSGACGWTPSDPSRMRKDEIRSASSENQMAIAAGNAFMENSLDEYELHTRLCRTSSGRTFESHSYYALDKARDNPAECKASGNAEKSHGGSLFASSNFKKELKETTTRKKSRDPEKRHRKQQSRNYDSDESASDQERRYPRSKAQKKKASSEHKGASFSRNHPHRSGARMRANGHVAGDQASGATSQPSAPQQRHYNSELI